MTSLSASAYVQRSVQELAKDIDLDRFRNAWAEAVRRTPILRTRIIHDSRQGLLQVVINKDIQWEYPSNLQDYLEDDSATAMSLGQPLAHYALVMDSASGRTWFVWTLHHAIYDGHFLGNLRSLIIRLYQYKAFGYEMQDFKYFAKYLAGLDYNQALTYWRDALSGYEAEPFPPILLARQADRAGLSYSVVSRQCTVKSAPGFGVTISAYLRAAWALTAAAASGTEDVVFGAIISGRHAAIAGIESVAGPTVATVPVRVRISYAQSVGEFLRAVQEQSTEMIAHEQTGLQYIQTASPTAKRACQFQTLLVTQLPDDAP